MSDIAIISMAGLLCGFSFSAYANADTNTDLRTYVRKEVALTSLTMGSISFLMMMVFK